MPVAHTGPSHLQRAGLGGPEGALIARKGKQSRRLLFREASRGAGRKRAGELISPESRRKHQHGGPAGAALREAEFRRRSSRGHSSPVRPLRRSEASGNEHAASGDGHLESTVPIGKVTGSGSGSRKVSLQDSSLRTALNLGPVSRKTSKKLQSHKQMKQQKAL